MNETILIWLSDLLDENCKINLEDLTTNEIRAEIEQVQGAISNERLWELGYDGEEPLNPHTDNIMTLMEYLDVLNEMIANKEDEE